MREPEEEALGQAVKGVVAFLGVRMGFVQGETAVGVRGEMGPAV